MKSNKLVIAAAGSGKTTYLVRKALETQDGRVLITTYTQANEAEIRKKFIELNGCVPSHVTIQTWFSTLLQHGVRPFQGGLYEKQVQGMLLVNKASAIRFVNKNGVGIPFSETTHFEKHYFNSDSKIYSDKISKFVVRCNVKHGGAVIDRLSRIFPNIFIDEIQDLAGNDLELVKLLLQSSSNIIFVGDPRQVTYLTHIERQYIGYREGKIKDFIQTECRGITCEIDEKTLNVSYRNNTKICEYSSKLFPEYSQCRSNQTVETGHDGVFFVRPNDVDEYLDRFKPIQLRDSVRESVNKNHPCMNFGESKGQTYDRVLIYPTENFVKWIFNNNFSLPATSRSKLYVALTRAKYSVGIIYDFKDNTEIAGIEKYIV